MSPTPGGMSSIPLPTTSTFVSNNVPGFVFGASVRFNSLNPNVIASTPGTGGGVCAII